VKEQEIAPPSGKPTGRPSSYTEAVANEIGQRMTTGQGLLRICADDHMPDRATVYRWLEANDGFRDRYVRAREALMDFYAEQILVIAFDESGDIVVDQAPDGRSKTVANHAKVQRDRLKVDSLKWIASRLFPKRYGDKMELLGQDGGSSSTIKISWLESDKAPIAPEPQPPKQITYQKPELPADLSERDWSVLVSLLKTVKRTIPSNSDDPPELVFGIMRDALLAHYAEEKPAKPVVLKPRGRSGK
jgi:hypothetical protein